MSENESTRIKELIATVYPHRWRLFAAVMVVFAAMPFLVSQSTVVTLSLVFIYGILAFSAIVPIGYANQLILCQGAFFGVGAYSFVLLTTSGVPSWVSIPAAVLTTTAVALMLALPALRAKGIYLGILTLVFNLIFVQVLIVFPDIFGGDQGLSSPDLYLPEALVSVVPRTVIYYYLTMIFYLVIFLGFHRLLDGEIGWSLLSLKEETYVAESIGVNTRKYRMLSFAFAGSVGGIGGAIYAPVTGYISPGTFDLDATIDIILAGVLGGISVLEGALLGAFVVRYLPEALAVVDQYRMVLFGLLLIAILIYLPEGVGGYIKEKLR